MLKFVKVLSILCLIALCCHLGQAEAQAEDVDEHDLDESELIGDGEPMGKTSSVDAFLMRQAYKLINRRISKSSVVSICKQLRKRLILSMMIIDDILD